MARNALGYTRRVAAILSLTSLLFAEPALAQEAIGDCDSGDGVCVREADLQDLLAIAKGHKCLEETKPKFKVDEVVIITDVDGRVFHTGADPARPFEIKVSWCHYEILAEGKVKLVAAVKEPETWGFRFRPKAYLGHLVSRLGKADSTFSGGVDAGLMLDLFHVEWVNLNAAVGFRSVGVDIGFDLTENFGAHVGYRLGWQAPLHNVGAGLHFAF
jgi:hypothetical protein